MGQLQERFKHYREPQKFMEADVYPYFREIEGKQGTEVENLFFKLIMLLSKSELTNSISFLFSTICNNVRNPT